jgi:hypothetical protein
LPGNSSGIIINPEKKKSGIHLPKPDFVIKSGVSERKMY